MPNDPKSVKTKFFLCFDLAKIKFSSIQVFSDELKPIANKIIVMQFYDINYALS